MEILHDLYAKVIDRLLFIMLEHNNNESGLLLSAQGKKIFECFQIGFFNKLFFEACNFDFF
jgi:hypothetical protein